MVSLHFYHWAALALVSIILLVSAIYVVLLPFHRCRRDMYFRIGHKVLLGQLTGCEMGETWEEVPETSITGNIKDMRKAV